MARQSKIILCKNIKLDRENKNVLTYSEADMLTLVNSTGIKVAEASDYSFIGKGDRDAITVGFTYATCLGCNYMAFQNYNYSNKWYFAFIDKVEYISEGTTRLHYTVDIFSTWFDYWSNKACYVVREHSNSDTVGENTIDEGLALGDTYVVRSYTKDSNIQNKTSWVIASTYDPLQEQEELGGQYQGLYSGVIYYSFSTAQGLDTNLKKIINSDRGMSAIQCVFTAPTFLVSQTQDGQVPTSPTVATYNITITPITTIGSYTPKNAKLLTYPYCYIELSNGVGASSILHQELWSKNQQGNYALTVDGALCPGCSVRMSPVDYNGASKNIEEGISLGKFPICNFAGDPYVNWLTQNGVNIFTDVVGSALNLGMGVGGAGSGSISSGVFGLINAGDELRRAELVPPQVKGNLNAGDVMFSDGQLTFHFYKKTIKEEIARSIDDYLSMYGYKTNKLKVANQTGRTYWNYVQIGPNETIGYQKTDVLAVPPQDLVNINKLYQRGITLWHNHSTMGDYTQTNNIVTP